MNFFKEWTSGLSQSIMGVDADKLDEVSQLLLKCSDKGAKVVLVGNGGSAAIASHVSVDLTKTVAVRAINFNEADLITCFANDYGYENWVSKAIEFYCDKNDIIILISSSGQSKNMINGAEKARQMGLKVITFTGFSSKNKLRNLGETEFWVDSSQYNVVEMVHQAWLLAVVDRIKDIRDQKRS